MIYRHESSGWLAITQPAHAWLAGQLAAAWGNDAFARPVPHNAVIIATSLHDIGWQAWDLAPRLHPDGRPVNFIETSLEETREIWQRGVDHAGLLDPYAALLVSMHASTIYSRRLERGAGSPQRQAEVQTLIDDTLADQSRMKSRLEVHPIYREAIQPAPLNANYRILRVCDLLSLALCTGPLDEGSIADVPGASPDERLTINYSPLNDSTLALFPYPFSIDELAVSAMVRWLPESNYPGRSALHEALNTAPWRSIEYTFVSAVLAENVHPL